MRAYLTPVARKQALNRGIVRHNGHYVDKPPKTKSKPHKRFQNDRTLVAGNADRAKKVLASHGYQAYLKTAYWLALHGKLCPPRSRCFGCRRDFPSNRFQLHHLRYDCLGNEGPDDLIRLCGKCHGDLHDHLDKLFPGQTVSYKARRTSDVWRTLFDCPLEITLARYFWRDLWVADTAQVGEVFVRDDPAPKCKPPKRKRKKPRNKPRQTQPVHQNKKRRKGGPQIERPGERPRPKPSHNTIDLIRRVQPCGLCKITLAEPGSRLCSRCQQRATRRRNSSRQRQGQKPTSSTRNGRLTTL